MQIKQKGHSIDSLFSFLLLLIFCLFTLMLSGTGSAIYRKGTAYLNENYTSRTAVAYITEKVRQHNETDAVFMTSIGTASSGQSSLPDGPSESEETSGNIPALAFRDTIDGTVFITYVYFYDDALCELMIQESRTPAAAMGSPIVELSSLSMKPISGTNLLSVTAAGEEDRELSVLIHVSGGLKQT